MRPILVYCVVLVALTIPNANPMLPFLQSETLPAQDAKQIEAQKTIDKYNFFGPSTIPTPGIPAPKCEKLSSATLMGCLAIKDGQDNIPEFKVCFDGKYTYNNKEGFFTIPVDDDNLGKFSLLICKNFDQKFISINTIDHLNAIPEKHYKYYTFKRLNNGQWIQKEKRLEKKKFAVPKHCVILMIDPKYVDHIESWSILLPGNYLKLPKIVLKDSPKLAYESRKSVLYTLDSNVFHGNATATKQRIVGNSKVQVSLVR